MKTIAVTIDEPTLARLDRFLSGKVGRLKSRSAVIRRALQEFSARLEDERERAIIRKRRSLLKRQAASLVKEQARP